MSKISLVKNVVQQVINMLDNNVIKDNGFEPFEGWCENGDVFENEETQEREISIMKRLAPFVDALSIEIEKEKS